MTSTGSVQEPPINEPLFREESRVPSIPWALFFDSIWRGDRGTVWTPTFTGLTITGTPTITGRFYRVGRALCYFRVKIVPSTDTTAVAGTTYINNFPLTLSADGACNAVSGLLGSNAGMCDSATNRIYVPAWTGVTVPLTIVGTVEAG